MGSFEDLDRWESCRELRRFIHQNVLPKLPSEERYRLNDQLVRAARSTSANIAEGFGCRHYLDNTKFIRNSFGSQHECLDHLITAVDEGLIPEAGIDEFRPVFEEAKAPSKGSAAYLAKFAKR